MKSFLTILVALVVGFLIGFVPLAAQKAELEGKIKSCAENLKNVYDRLEIAEGSLATHNLLIGAFRAVLEKNYGIAQERVSEALDKAKPLAEKGIDPYPSILAQRDNLIASVARGDKDTEREVRAVLLSLYQEIKP